MLIYDYGHPRVKHFIINMHNADRTSLLNNHEFDHKGIYKCKMFITKFTSIV